MANRSDIFIEMTFGIELEFIAVFPDYYFEQHVLEGDRQDAITSISRALQARGISTGHENLDDDEDINSNAESYSMWNVSHEGGLRLSKGERSLWDTQPAFREYDYFLQSVEVSSRKLRIKDAWPAELAKVLSIFDELSSDNETFGGHRLPLRTVKSVLQLCTAFESRLDALYQTNRIDPDNAYQRSAPGHFNANLSWHFGSNKNTNFAKNVCHWLSAIEECSTYEELGKFFENDLMNADSDGQANMFHTDSHFSTLNMENLYASFVEDEHAEPTGTIEFRQHGGTLDLKEISAHVMLKATLVSFCHTASDVDFLQLIAQASNPEFRLFELLAATGADSELLEYYRQRFSVEGQAALKTEYNRNLKKLADKEKVFGFDALKIKSEVEKFTRSSAKAVADKIELKENIGAYAGLNMRAFDIEGEYNKFVEMNEPAIQDAEKLSNLARTRVFIKQTQTSSLSV